MGRRFQGAGRVYLLKLQAERERAAKDQVLSNLEQLEEKLLQGVNKFMAGYSRVMMLLIIPGAILFFLLSMK